MICCCCQRWRVTMVVRAVLVDAGGTDIFFNEVGGWARFHFRWRHGDFFNGGGGWSRLRFLWFCGVGYREFFLFIWSSSSMAMFFFNSFQTLFFLLALHHFSVSNHGVSWFHCQYFCSSLQINQLTLLCFNTSR